MSSSTAAAALRRLFHHSLPTARIPSLRSDLHPQSPHSFDLLSSRFLSFFPGSRSLLHGSGIHNHPSEEHGISGVSDPLVMVQESDGLFSNPGMLSSCRGFWRPWIFARAQYQNSLRDGGCDSLHRATGLRSFASDPSIVLGLRSASETKRSSSRPMFGGFLAPLPTPMTAPSSPNKYDTGADNLGFIRGLEGKQRQMIKKFVNICMMDGKKTKARALVYETFQNLAARGDVVTYLDKAVENVRPICEVKRVRVAGVTHNVPSTIAKHRQETLALRWLLEAAVKRRSSKKSVSLGKCLCDEILDASQKTGMARKKRDDLHKLAEVNRTFAHYRWW